MICNIVIGRVLWHGRYTGDSQGQIGSVDGPHVQLLPLDTMEATLPVRDFLVAGCRRQIGGVDDFVLQGDHDEALPGVKGQKQAGEDDRRQEKVWDMDLPAHAGSRFLRSIATASCWPARHEENRLGTEGGRPCQWQA